MNRALDAHFRVNRHIFEALERNPIPALDYELPDEWPSLDEQQQYWSEELEDRYQAARDERLGDREDY